MNFKIRIANNSDKQSLIKFIKNKWNSDHVFVKNPDFFDYMHLSKNNKNEYNFVIAEDKDSKAILAIHGFITPAHYDSNLTNKDVFLAIWKALDVGIPGLGIRTLEYIHDHLNARLIEAISFDEEVTELYQMLGFTTGYLSHYVLFNPKIKEFQIARNVEPGMLLNQKKPENYYSLKVGKIDLLNEHSEESISKLLLSYLPIKSKSYLINKYAKHPHYDYEYAIATEGKDIKFIAVLRKLEVKKAKIIRIVDFLGDESFFPKVTLEFQNLLQECEAEYLDFYFHGLNKSYFEKSGFVNRKSYPDLIIPNYFEPFVSKNIDLNFAVRFPNEINFNQIRLFKGHGDQDRPSIIDKKL